MRENFGDICARTTLAVLAGGEGRRMGKPKGLLRLHDTPILTALYQRLAWSGPTLLVTTPGREKPPGHELFSAEAVDPVAGEGPLRGVLTALEHSKTPLLVVIPLDMPRLTTAALAWLASKLDEQPDKAFAMVARRNGAHDRIEPLPAVFAVDRALTLVRQSLAEGRAALHDLADHRTATLVGCPASWPRDLWVNLNRPEDVTKYLEDLRAGVAP